MMYIEKKIKIPIYLADFLIIITDDVKELKRKYGIKVDNDEIFSHTFLITPKRGKFYYETHCAIFNYNRPNGANPELPDIAHEAFHLAVNLLDEKGVKFDFNNDEPFAYMITWFVREITKFVYGKQLAK